MACFEVIRSVLSQGFMKVRILMDSSKLVNFLCKGRKVATEAENIITEGLYIYKKLDRGYIVKVYRLIIYNDYILIIKIMKRILFYLNF